MTAPSSPSRAVGPSRSRRALAFARVSGTRHNPIADYVVDVASEGPPIGSINGHPIPATVVDRAGLQYGYVGLAPRCRDGRLDVNALNPNEWIVRPGLVYALAGSEVIP